MELPQLAWTDSNLPNLSKHEETKAFMLAKSVTTSAILRSSIKNIYIYILSLFVRSNWYPALPGKVVKRLVAITPEAKARSSRKVGMSSTNWENH